MQGFGVVQLLFKRFIHHVSGVTNIHNTDCHHIIDSVHQLDKVTAGCSSCGHRVPSETRGAN